VRIEYVGHATVVVDLDGVRLVTDPLLRNRVVHLRRAVRVDVRAIRGVDAVLVSHAHYDHLDLPSLGKLGREMPIVVPKGLGGFLRKRRFEHVSEIEAGESVRIGSVEVRAVHAEHDETRGLFGVKAPPVGYVVSGSRSVYFAGDTDLFDGMRALAPVDVAILPIGGWGPRVPAGHLDPLRAAEALRLVRPATVVPVHWGTYRAPFAAEPDDRPAQEFVRAAAEAAPDVDVRVLRIGETLHL